MMWSRFPRVCRKAAQDIASAASRSEKRVGVVMLNMGGPAKPQDTSAFLQRLFSDGEIIDLGRFQNVLGPMIAKRRTPDIEKQYEKIGGSPIRKWTEHQAAGMVDILNRKHGSVDGAFTFSAYTAFRYADPLTEEALLKMKEDGIEHAIAFSQYPQYSCTTSGSSFNHLWRELERLNMKETFKWSVIDRWYTEPHYIEAVCTRIQEGLSYYSEEAQRDVVLMFSAHSLPMRVVNRGDPYPQEVAATVQLVMERLKQLHINNQYVLAWQSQVGPLPWLGPQTGDVLKGLGEQGHRNVLAIPIAFTSDHIETLFEIDIEYAHMAKEAGVTGFQRAPSLNDQPLLQKAQAALVAKTLASQAACTPQYELHCPSCTNVSCRQITNPIVPYSSMKDRNASS